MTRDLYDWKPTSSAEIHLRESEYRRELEQSRNEHSPMIDRSREWIKAYQSTPRPTKFNWSPRLPQVTKEITNAKEAHHHTAQAPADQDVPQGLGDTQA
jgi:hypothetical protein